MPRPGFLAALYEVDSGADTPIRLHIPAATSGIQAPPMQGRWHLIDWLRGCLVPIPDDPFLRPCLYAPAAADGCAAERHRPQAACRAVLRKASRLCNKIARRKRYDACNKTPRTQIEAQHSGFDLERRSDGVDEV